MQASMCAKNVSINHLDTDDNRFFCAIILHCDIRAALNTETHYQYTYNENPADGNC